MTIEEHSVKALLHQAELLARLAEEPGRRFDERYAPRFNPVGMIVAETGWSKLIAALLDPNGDHGQGRLFLDAFLREVEIEPAQFPDPVSVYTEHQLGTYGRIDVLITTVSAVLGVEVKLDAADQVRQLARYHAALSKARGVEPVLVYLAKPGAEPSAASMDGMHESQVAKLALATEHSKERSFARSLRTAVRECRAERVRLFVELTIEALEWTCGVRQSVKDPRSIMTESFLSQRPDLFPTALAIRNALPAARNTYLANFAHLLEREILKILDSFGNGWRLMGRTLVDEPSTEHHSLEFAREFWSDRYCIAIDRSGSGEGARYRYGVSWRERSNDEAEATHIAATLGMPRGDDWWPCRSYLPAPLQQWASDEGMVRLTKILSSPTPDKAPEVRKIVGLMVELARKLDAYITSANQPPGGPPAVG